MRPVSEEQKNSIQKLIEYYCQNLAENKVDGSSFDNKVLDTLKELKKLIVLETPNFSSN
jgi:hypothetical protein